MSFLPVTREEMTALGWESPDFVYVTGDAYVDHPSFGVAIITRVLENCGYKVAVVSQPQRDGDYTRFGRPKYGFFVSSGNIDSMVAHYTVAKKRRSTDAYTAGGIMGRRPDRAVIVYSKAIRRIYGDIPIVIGGLEASLRRFAHYDYWDDAVRPSILIDSGADLISYGMGEKQTKIIADRLASGESISTLRDIRGTCYAVPVTETPYEGAECPSFENVVNSKTEYARSCKIQHKWQDFVYGKVIKQRHGKMMLVQNPPMEPLNTQELDAVYALPYERTYHPMYETQGGVPGIQEVEFSICHNRGCFGDCNFCSIAFHQGRFITTRSKESILEEARKLTTLKNFKGYIHDVGGPTANFRAPSCEKQLEHGLCPEKKCLAPTPCKNLKVDHSEYSEILREIQKIPKIKKVFIRSGIRYDYMLCDKNDDFFRQLVSQHVSGQIKVAPEHCAAAVLDKMGKPHIEAYIEFEKKFFQYSGQAGKEQYIVPYLMSSHPGCTVKEAVELAVFLKKRGIRPEQVQDFYPTPGTISTCMFYTGIDPITMTEVYVPTKSHEKAMQRALLQYFLPQNKNLVREALKIAGRTDLIGNTKDCLINSFDERPKNKTNSHMGKRGKNTNAKSKGKRKN